MPRTDPRLLKAADWMLAKEVRHKGDWAVKVRNQQPGGWYFEFNNEFYPDTDDSAQVLLALNKVDNIARERYQYEVCQRAISWIFAMQCKNGGWGSFDKDNTKMVFENIPFADHNAMLDPPTVDITGRILEMLATYGYTQKDRRVEKAIKLHLSRAGARWKLVWPLGCELYVRGPSWCCAAWKQSAYGITSRRFSRPPSGSAWCRTATAAGVKAAPATTIPTPAVWGPSTPSQTAWAILGIAFRRRQPQRFRRQGCALAAGAAACPMDRGTKAWAKARARQAIITGTGFPRVFYLAYHLYRNYFPLLALTDYRRAMEKSLGIKN